MERGREGGREGGISLWRDRGIGMHNDSNMCVMIEFT